MREKKSDAHVFNEQADCLILAYANIHFHPIKGIDARPFKSKTNYESIFDLVWKSTNTHRKRDEDRDRERKILVILSYPYFQPIFRVTLFHSKRNLCVQNRIGGK